MASHYEVKRHKMKQNFFKAKNTHLKQLTYLESWNLGRNNQCIKLNR